MPSPTANTTAAAKKTGVPRRPRCAPPGRDQRRIVLLTTTNDAPALLRLTDGDVRRAAWSGLRAFTDDEAFRLSAPPGRAPMEAPPASWMGSPATRSACRVDRESWLLLWRTAPSHGRRTLKELARYLWDAGVRRQLRDRLRRLVRPPSGDDDTYRPEDVLPLRCAVHVALGFPNVEDAERWFHSGGGGGSSSMSSGGDTTTAPPATLVDGLGGDGIGTSSSSSSNTITGRCESLHFGAQCVPT